MGRFERHVSDRSCQTSKFHPDPTNPKLDPGHSDRSCLIETCEPVQLNQQSFELPGFFLSKMSLLGQVILMS